MGNVEMPIDTLRVNVPYNKIDLVNHPPHYTQYSFEVIEIIDEVTAHVSGQDGYMIGNVIKYILRAPFKGGLESLKKAKWYLDNLIERIENEGGTYGIKR